MVSALGKALDTKMPSSVLVYEKTEKANHQAMAYLALALKPMYHLY